jgi:hypothetical protein
MVLPKINICRRTLQNRKERVPELEEITENGRPRGFGEEDHSRKPVRPL